MKTLLKVESNSGKMKAKYWYVHGTDIVDTTKKDQEVKALRAKRRKAKALRTQKK